MESNNFNFSFYECVQFLCDSDGDIDHEFLSHVFPLYDRFDLRRVFASRKVNQFLYLVTPYRKYSEIIQFYFYVWFQIHCRLWLAHVYPRKFNIPHLADFWMDSRRDSKLRSLFQHSHIAFAILHCCLDCWIALASNLSSKNFKRINVDFFEKIWFNSHRFQLYAFKNDTK